MFKRIVLAFTLASSLTLPLFAQSLSWNQWSKDPQHTGQINVAGQSFNSVLADIVYDPFAAAEQAASDDDLLVHYQTPLTDGDDMFMEFKSGNFTQVSHWETQNWDEKRFHWEGGQLVEKWTFHSDWKPVPYASNQSGNGPSWEPVFHAVLAGGFVYVPGAGGTVYKLDRTSGAVAAQINPFGGSVNTNIFVAGPLSADNSGNVYYNAIQLTQGRPWDNDVVNSWLVKIAPSNAASKATFASLTPGAPSGTDLCKVGFSETQLPWPPTPTTEAPTSACGSQRPGINVAPAVAPDGTIYTLSRAHFLTRYNYLIAVNPNLTVKWTASTRGRLNDGCNVLLPPNGTPGGCRTGATTGVDPATNEPPPGRVLDDGTSSPTVGPDGAVYIGVYTRYNFAQGHLFKFDKNGKFKASYPFGWDVTPAIYQHDGTYSVVIKDNHYGEVGSYCNTEAFCPEDRTGTYPNDPESYFITRLNPALNVEWRFQNTNTLSCARQPDNTVTCVSDHPSGFEWCVNAFGVDSNGIVYANSEDGNLYAINPDGSLHAQKFLQLAIGAAYTPLTVGPDGKFYTQNFGHLFVVGN